VTNNMNNPSDPNQSGSTFYIYNYSPLTISYNISENDNTSLTFLIAPQTCDTWTWIGNSPTMTQNQLIS
jgi:hypothetical protein